MHIIYNLAEEPLLCFLLSLFFFLADYFLLYMLLGALLKMHRSKSAVKKLLKAYTFRQKLWLIPFERDCLHAVGFCRFLVWFARIRVLLFGVYLLPAILCAFGFLPATILAWLSAGIFLCLDAPLLLIDWLLSRPLIGRRFKEFSFQKYHNTSDHSSLF